MHGKTDSLTAIIILSYNNSEDTINCIRSVCSHNSAPVCFIVVDNGSSKPHAVKRLTIGMESIFGNKLKIIKQNDSISRLPEALLIIADRNAGYAQGNNIGLDAIKSFPEIEHILILNNDILFTSDIIPGLIHAADEAPSCAIVSPLLFGPDGTTIDYNCARKAVRLRDLVRQNFCHYIYRALRKNDEDFSTSRFILHQNPQSSEIVEIELPSGSCMLIKHSLFKQIEGFDPNTFLYYEEDILHRKFQKLGLKSYLDPSQSCIHLGAGSTKHEPSEKMLRADRQSQKYFVENYLKPGKIAKFVYLCSLKFHSGTTWLQKKSKHLCNRFHK